MSLATRCPSCGTVFRVVRDQLKVSDGWVRCGRCSDVFNAVQRLFELEAEGPGGATAASESAETTAPHADAERSEPAHTAAAAPAPALPPEPEPEPEPELELELDAASEPAPQAEATFEPPVQAGSAVAHAPQPMAALADTGPDSTEPPPLAESAAERAAAQPAPEFIRRADRAAQRHRAQRRGPLALLALLLLVLLGGQMGLHYRDRLAAEWPAARPLLQAACGVLGCTVDAPRRIDSLQVDSSGLVRMEGSALYRLSLVLRNKAPTAVRTPAVELALSDAQGLTIARRVFSAGELGPSAPSLAPGGELSLQATLDLGERRVAGYTVELFYP